MQTATSNMAVDQPWQQPARSVPSLGLWSVRRSNLLLTHAYFSIAILIGSKLRLTAATTVELSDIIGHQRLPTQTSDLVEATGTINLFVTSHWAEVISPQPSSIALSSAVYLGRFGADLLLRFSSRWTYQNAEHQQWRKSDYLTFPKLSNSHHEDL